MKLTLVLTPARPGEKRKFTCPPLGLLYLGSYAKQLGHRVNIIDGDVEGYTLDELAQKIVNKKADLIGITVMTPFAANVLNLCKKIKKINPQSKIVLGGIHITATGVEMMESSPYVDFLVLSEGEETLAELLQTMANKANKKDLKDIQGLIYRNANRQIIKNELRSPIKNIDSLPIPDLGLIENLNFKNYNVIHAGSKCVVYILGSRGCPFLCTFCAAHLVHGRPIRFREPKKIVDEIEYNQKKYDVKYVGFKDGTFTLNHKWVKEICQEIINRNLKIGFCINARINTLSKELLDTLERAGCETIGFGIESGSQEILNKLKKGTTLEQIRNGFKLLKNYKFFTINSFMLGNPGDTLETIKQTFNLAKELNSTGVGFCPTTAFPGTEMYDEAVRDGTLKNPKWYLKPDLNHQDEFLETGVYDGVLLFPDFKPEQEVARAYQRFYFRPSYLFLVIKKIMADPYFLKYALGYALGIVRKTFDNT